jgi:hypothetical protein
MADASSAILTTKLEFRGWRRSPARDQFFAFGGRFQHGAPAPSAATLARLYFGMKYNQLRACQ